MKRSNRRMILFLILTVSCFFENEAFIAIEPNHEACSTKILLNPSSPYAYFGHFHQISPEFWSDGVDSSRDILNTVLKKINNAGSQLDYLLKEHSSLIIRNRFQEIKNGEIWFDKEETPRMSLNIDAVRFCAAVDTVKVPLPELSYTCEESEQLYGVGYHKVYEGCKNEPFFEKINADWPTCLHAHYPWVDMLESSICIVKSYVNDFLACFCTMEDGKITRRGFCVTKLECALTAIGNKEIKPRHEILSTDCFARIHYFLEGKTMEKIDFENAKLTENLRVRPPYHPESVCYHEQFSSLFDIGQLDADNIEAGMMVYTPKLGETPEQTNNDEDLSNPILEEELKHIVKIGALKIVMVKRILLNVTSLILGAVFFTLTKLKVYENTPSFVLTILQMVILTLGTLNFLVSIIPDHLEVQVVVLVPVFVQLVLNNKENTSVSLQVSFLNMFLETILWILLNKGFGNILTVSNAYFVSIGIWTIQSLHRVYEPHKYPERSGKNTKTKTETIKKKKVPQKENKKETQKEAVNLSLKKGKEEKQKPKQKHLDKNVVKISCYNKSCNTTTNIGYVSLKCSENCCIEFHNECWQTYQATQGIIGQRCPGKLCLGEIQDIVSVDRIGKETGKQHKLLKTMKETNTISKFKKTESLKNTGMKAGIKKPEKANKKSGIKENGSDSSHQNEQTLNQEDKLTVLKHKTVSSQKPMKKTGEKPMGATIEKTTTEGSIEYQTFEHKINKKTFNSECRSNTGSSPENIPHTAETQTLIYLPGKPDKEEIEPTVELPDKMEQGANAFKEPTACSPLTRILHKEVTGYTLEEIDKAVVDILSETDSASLTIPEFKEILMKKLEAEIWPDGIYISDDEE